jgi:hypothetical protein
MKSVLLSVCIVAASVSFASAQETVCEVEVEYCPEEEGPGADFGPDGISIFRPFFPNDPTTPWVRILPPNPIFPTDPLFPTDPVKIRPGVQQ